jgi:hypothetical protein
VLSRDHLVLWDLWFSGIMAKLWQHSSASTVSKLLSAYASLTGSGTNDPNQDRKSKPLIFMGCVVPMKHQSLILKQAFVDYIFKSSAQH